MLLVYANLHDIQRSIRVCRRVDDRVIHQSSTSVRHKKVGMVDVQPVRSLVCHYMATVRVELIDSVISRNAVAIVDPLYVLVIASKDGVEHEIESWIDGVVCQVDLITAWGSWIEAGGQRVENAVLAREDSTLPERLTKDVDDASEVRITNDVRVGVGHLVQVRGDTKMLTVPLHVRGYTSAIGECECRRYGAPPKAKTVLRR